MAESLQKDRLPKDNGVKFDIEHNFSLDDDIEEDTRSANPQEDSARKVDIELAESPILQIKQQPTPLKRQAIQPQANIPQQQFNSANPVPQQGFNNQNQFTNQQAQRYNNQNNQNQAPNVNQQQRFNNQNQFSQGFNGQNQFSNNQQFGNQQQFYSQATPRQIEDGGQERATL